MDACSLDLRKKIVDAKPRGISTAEVTRTFGVGASTVERYAAAAREGRSLASKRRPGSKPKLDGTARKLLEADLRERPAATLPQRREYLGRVSGAEVSDSTLSRMLKRLDWSLKRSVGATERDEFLRSAWKTMAVGSVGADRFVFVDECSTNTSLRPLYAWSKQGERAPGSAPR